MSLPQPVARGGPAPWVVVLLTLGAVALLGVVFVAGIAVGVVASRAGGGSASPGATTADPAPDAGGSTGGGGFDACLVGTWQSTEHTESYETEQGPASITELERTIQFGRDGSQTVTYDTSRATVTTDVGALPAIFDGSVVYEASTSGSTMSFELVSADGTVTILGPDGEVAEERPLEPGTGDVSYSCDDSSFVQEAQGFRSAYERVG